MDTFDLALKQSTTPGAMDCFIELKIGDAKDCLPTFEPESIHLIVTDPPYFLDGLDSAWNKGKNQKTTNGQVVSLPSGMKFDPKQGRNLQAFIETIGVSALPLLKPGAFALFFSQPRLAPRMAVGLEDAGFEIRDMYAWHYTKRAQFKAFSMNHFIDKMPVSTMERREIKAEMKNRKTAQLRPQFESIILAQKPKQGTHIENWLVHETGLIDTTQTLDGRVPSTVMTVEKPTKSENNKHLTVKPLHLVEYLIRLFSKPGHIVLDPFLGSGTTAIAALRTDRSCIGIEINPDYMKIAENRLKENQNDKT